MVVNNKNSREYIRKAYPVEAIQFRGWENAREIHLFTNGRTFFVPQGFENHMRYDNEKDRSTGYVLNEAPAYLILDNSRRVDLREWLVMGEDDLDSILVYSDAVFKDTFEKRVNDSR